MAQVGRQRYMPFRMADSDGNPVTGRVLADFVVTFLRNDTTGPDTLTVEEKGSGLYVLTYLPSAAGQDYIELYYPEIDLRIVDDEYVEGGEVSGDPIFALTQDTGGVGALKATVAAPTTFTLYVFKSQVWQSGDHSSYSADASTALDASGNWLTSPLPVLRDVYHVVLMSASGETHVIRPFLDLRTAVVVSTPPSGEDTSNSYVVVNNETPSGACDGENTTFGLTAIPTAGTEQVFLNGILLEPGTGNDYLLSGNTLTLLYPPPSGSKVRVHYSKPA